ncbi:zinc-binding dehydrogenase [Georgenia sp. AZ-5]|uniref:zinc-dependent alcohol dehydrogenase n=1 Tax=Georgenia sp. AZ-5 TaxID=3367526 RepID=UPI003754E34F
MTQETTTLSDASAALDLPASARASVTHPDGSTEVVSFPLVDCGDDGAWLRVEASGICGTDVGLAGGKLTAPTVLGHHAVGQIADIGPAAAKRWGLQVGDAVAVEEYLPCWECETCRTGRYRLCPKTDLYTGGRRIGLVPASEEPHLWGGNAEYLFLPANAVVHRLPSDLPMGLASWTQPVANAIDWVSRVGRLTPGERVVILGPGYHGLAAAVVARQLGAGSVLIGGLPRHEARLALAERLGATAFNTSSANLAGEVFDLTDGAMADVVLDTVGGGPESLTAAFELLRQGGRLVVAGAKKPARAAIDTEALLRGMTTVSGVRGRDPESVTRSIEMLADPSAGFAEIPTENVPLEGVGEMLARLGSSRGPVTPHVDVRPWAAQSTGEANG